jgi:hypothetical protein
MPPADVNSCHIRRAALDATTARLSLEPSASLRGIPAALPGELLAKNLRYGVPCIRTGRPNDERGRRVLGDAVTAGVASVAIQKPTQTRGRKTS